MNDTYDYLAQCLDSGATADQLLEIIGEFINENDMELDFRLFVEEKLGGP